MLRQTLVLKCLQNCVWLLHEKNHLISPPCLLSDVQYTLPFIPTGHFTGEYNKNIDRTLQNTMQIYHKDSVFGEIKALRSCTSTIKTFCTDILRWSDRTTSSLHWEIGGWLMLPLCPCNWRKYLPPRLREYVCYQLTSPGVTPTGSQVLLPSTAPKYCSQVLLPSTAPKYWLPSTAPKYCSQVLAPKYCSQVLLPSTGPQVQAPVLLPHQHWLARPSLQDMFCVHPSNLHTYTELWHWRLQFKATLAQRNCVNLTFYHVCLISRAFAQSWAICHNNK